MWRTWRSVVAIVGPSLLLVGQIARAEEAAILAKNIDQHISAQLDKQGLTRAAMADDAEFLRRIYLDLHGVVPSDEQATLFLDSQATDKRTRLVDELLASSRFGEHFGDIWKGRLLSSLVSDERERAERFAGWLAARFNQNDGWDKISFDLLTATGKLEEKPEVAYLIEGRHPLSVTDLADLSSRYFLGVRLNCAQCHDHPFVAWKQQDYWGMAAFFAQIQTPGRPKAVYQAGVQDNFKMTLATLKDADTIEGLQLASPTFLGGPSIEPTSNKPYRVAFAEWATAAENPYFARAMTNRMWWHFFGRGIVNPVDDMHAGNAPTHPELLDHLSASFIASGFDLKFLCRAIVTSQTYQQTSRSEGQPDDADKAFARMSLKALTAEQLYDSLVTVVGPPAKTSSGVNRLNARSEFAQFFASDGDPDPVRYERGIPHLLRLMNSPQFAGPNLTSLVAKAQAAGRSPDEVVEQLFLKILSRRPTASERQLVRAQVPTERPAPESLYRELAWALLMSSEFALNH